MSQKVPYSPNTAILIEKAKLHAHLSKKKLDEHFPHVKNKLEQLGLDLKDIRRHSAKIISGAVLAGGLILGSPTIQHTFPGVQHTDPVQKNSERDKALRDQLLLAIPKGTKTLTAAQEKDVSQIIKEVLNLPVTAELDGHRLNASYGRMGGEQHLPRYPGDTIGQHDELQVKGITANRGAFGYFAPSKELLTPEAAQREKYYVAVQTMYLPNWNHDYKTLKKWYEFRKVLVVNPSTGKSVVAVVGDAGPAAWTGKQYGGSPEIMQYLQPFANKNNGMVLLFFIDDKDNTIALGPVNKADAVYLAQASQ